MRRNPGERYLIQGLRPKHRNWVTVDFANEENRALLNALRRARLGDVAYRVWDTHLVAPVWQGQGKDAKIDRWQGSRPSGLVGANRRTTMLRNPRLSARMMPLRENTMRLGDAMKWGRRLLDAGIGVHLWDGSGWEVDFKPDDAYSTPSGRAATGGRRYLAQGAGLIKTWPITLTAPRVAPGIWLTAAAVGHFLAHRKAGVASNPGSCRNPICKKNPRREPYCRMCGKDKPHEGPFRTPKVGPSKGKLICDLCYRGWRSGRRSGEQWAQNRGTRRNSDTVAENARIAHEQIVSAFLAGRSKKIGPRYWTDGQLLRVWGNLVAKKEPGAVIIMDAGWRTLLTRNVLNTVLSHLGRGTIYQQKRQWYISTPTGKVTWPGEWTIPTGGAASNRRRVARNGRGENLTVADIGQWIDNDEGLYNWWRGSRQSKTAFIRDNRAELEASIRQVLNRPPAQKTWRDYAGSNPRVRAWDIVAYIPGKPERWVMQSGHKDKKKAEEIAKVYRDIAKKERRRHKYVVRPFRYSDTASRMKKNPLTQKEVDQLRRNETFYRMGQRIEVRAGNTKDAMQLQGAMQESRVIRERNRAKGVTFRPGPQGLTLRQQAALPNHGRARRNPVEGWVVTQDGETLKSFGTTPAGADAAFKFLHNYQTKSIARAILEEGYDIRYIRNGSVIYTAKTDPLFRLTAKKNNPLTRSESAVLLSQAKGHVALARAYRSVKKHGIASYAAGRAQGKAAAVRQFGPKSAHRAAYKILNRQAATNPGAGLTGLMKNGDAKKAMSFA